MNGGGHAPACASGVPHPPPAAGDKRKWTSSAPSTASTAASAWGSSPVDIKPALAQGAVAPGAVAHVSSVKRKTVNVSRFCTSRLATGNGAAYALAKNLISAHLAGRSTVNARVYAEVRVDGKGLGVAKELGCVNGRSLSPRTVTFKGFSTFDSRDKLTSTRRIRLGRTTPVDDGSAAPAAATACVGRITVSLSVRYEHPTKKVELPRVVRPPRRRPRAGAGLLSSAAGSPLANGPPLADAEDTAREAVRWIRGFADLAVTLHYREPFWFFRNRFTNEAGRPLIVSTRHHEEAMAAAAARTAAKAAKAATTAAAATEAGAATPSASGEAGPLAPVADGDSDCEVVEEGAAGYVPPPAADQRKVLASVAAAWGRHAAWAVGLV
ncbi:hypothetical protein I4F81_000722 [Pyropia yezoensis]|uniref:Uncharacterized protein n=1 Tax=Pyropia yezoensis TaxID=2788 RepID=A0ACC3BJG6_PYRYE|nr:hypothetical protein I4F81_000722 [Neopyropia yezoensis]